MTPSPSLGAFVTRCLVVLLVVALALAAWRLADLALLLFGAILIAIGLRAGSLGVARLTGIGAMAGLVVVVILFLASMVVALWFFGTVAAGQMEELTQQIPAGLQILRTWFLSQPYGQYALDRARDAGAAGATGWAGSVLASLAASVTSGFGYMILAFMAAIYLAAQPERYCKAFLRLVPRDYRGRTKFLFGETDSILRRWLLGRLLVMAVVGILSGFGLRLLGIEAAFALGLVGGLLTFIPFVGAVLAAGPAVLVALTQGPAQVGAVVLMYVAVHFVEGNFITPLVQAEATALPPVISLLSTVAFSILFGPVGVLLAAPLTLFLILVVEVFYRDPGP